MVPVWICNHGHAADGGFECFRDKVGGLLLQHLQEAVELVIALAEGEKPPIIAEAADVLYHLLVALRSRGVGLGDVMQELERRTAQSGLAEKASRTNG